MFKNYLKIALRNLRKHKGYAFINIAGLALGFASSILILLYVQNELTYDAFHEKADNIHYVYKERRTGIGVRLVYDTWVPMLGEMRGSYPGIVDGVRMFTRSRWVRFGDKKFQDNVTYSDPSLFRVFNFPLKSGEVSTALQERYSAILTQEMAEKYFGDENPIGKTLNIDYDTDYVVAGVLADIPENSTITLDIVVPFDSIIDPEDERANTNWGGSFLDTYVLLDGRTPKGDLEAQFPQLVEKIWGQDGPNGSRNHSLRLLPLAEMHNHFTNSDRYVFIFSGIALAILLIGAINFMNLATARSLERAREIGMRKVMGALRGQLIGQFLGESMIISLISLVLGVLFTEALLPLFNDLFGTSLFLDYADNGLSLLALAGLGLFVGLFAGIYPALFLSRFQPAESLKGQLKNNPASAGRRLRNALLIVQFALSIMLIMGTGVVYKQIQFMLHRDMNFNRENIVTLQVGVRDFEDRETAGGKLQALRNELLQTAGILGVSSSTSVPGNYAGFNTFARPEDWQQPEPLRMRVAAVDEAYFDLFEIDFLEGRNFSPEFSTDAESAIIINETAMKAMNWQTAVGKKVYRGDTPMTVVGVVKDFNWQSLESEIAPLIHIYRPTGDGIHGMMSVKLAPGDVVAQMENIRATWRKIDPQRELDYFFVDENFDRLYETEQRIGVLSSYFGGLAIVLASMGLFAMVSFTVTQKTKEIGIRKTLGATVPGLVFLLLKSFLLLVGAAFLLAWPVTYYLLGLWLQNYAFHTTPGVVVFLLAGLIATTIAVLTSSYQSIKAAQANPVDTLRFE